jgi:hypothetical protein
VGGHLFGRILEDADRLGERLLGDMDDDEIDRIRRRAP